MMSPRTTTPTAPVEDTITSITEAIASAELEGVRLSDEFREDARLAADGEIDEDELVARTLARHRGAGQPVSRPEIGSIVVMGDTGGVGARVNIVADMVEPPRKREPRPDGVIRAPEPARRPDGAAQWDEVQARWIEWDAASGTWVPVEEAHETSNDLTEG